MVWHAYVCVVYWNLNHKISARLVKALRSSCWIHVPKVGLFLKTVSVWLRYRLKKQQPCCLFSAFWVLEWSEDNILLCVHWPSYRASFRVLDYDKCRVSSSFGGLFSVSQLYVLGLVLWIRCMLILFCVGLTCFCGRFGRASGRHELYNAGIAQTVTSPVHHRSRCMQLWIYGNWIGGGCSCEDGWAEVGSF